SGSRGIVAVRIPLSNPRLSNARPSDATEPDEPALARLEHGPVEPRRVDLVRGDGLAVDPHPALVDLPPPVARRGPEHLLQHRGQVRLERDGALGDLLGRLVLPDDAGEPLLAGARALRPVPARRDPARELELPFHRLRGMLAAAGEELPPLRQRLVGDRHRLAEHLLRRLLDADVVAARLRHLLGAVEPDEQWIGDDELRRLPVALEHVAAREQVVELVGAADLDVGVDRDRVVGLHRRVEEFGRRDRLLGGHPLREVVALEQARHGEDARQPDDLGERELREPLAVEAHLRPLPVEHAERLVREALRVRVELLVREHRALRRAAGRVADACRVVAHDQDDRVAGVLPRAQLVEHEREAEVDVRRGGIDAELDAQRPAERELSLELALRKHVNCMPSWCKVAQRGEPYSPRRRRTNVSRELAHLSDEALVALAARSEQPALAELYDRYGRPAYALARRILRDDALAEDAVQEAFLTLWRTAARFVPERGKASTWILTLVHRRAVDLVRREERRRTDALEREETDLDQAGRPVDEDVWLRLQRERVQAALRQLPDQQREAIELAYYGGFTQSELADRL